MPVVELIVEAMAEVGAASSGAGREENENYEIASRECDLYCTASPPLPTNFLIDAFLA